MSVRVIKHLFTVDEYHKMIEAGIFMEDARVELINGEIIEMSPIGSKHAGNVKRLNNLFGRLLGDQVIISVQDPVQLTDYSEPEPDIALLKPRGDFYTDSHPKPEDIELIIEVAETSINYDRDDKTPLYANSLISEVWIHNLNDDLLEVYRDPQNDRYQTVLYLHRGQSITPLNFPNLKLTVDEILG